MAKSMDTPCTSVYEFSGDVCVLHLLLVCLFTRAAGLTAAISACEDDGIEARPGELPLSMPMEEQIDTLRKCLSKLEIRGRRRRRP